MAYQSLYRRYRPPRFGEVRGQEHLVRALRNAVREDRVGHAYLFSGPRGTGKTSTARILAKVLNCERPVDGEPCGVCAVVPGHRGRHQLRRPRARRGVEQRRRGHPRPHRAGHARHARAPQGVHPRRGPHAVDRGAEAALLKTLEEPPEHVVFVLATTDPQKVLPTIRSRTQHFEFHLLPDRRARPSSSATSSRDAGLDVSPEAVDVRGAPGAGSARDMLSALDQVVAAGGVRRGGRAARRAGRGAVRRDTARALVAVATAVHAGRDPRTLAEHLVARLRDVFLSLDEPRPGPPPRPGRRASWPTRPAASAPPPPCGPSRCWARRFVDIRDAPDPRLLLDVALVRLTRPDADVSPAGLLARIERLEREGRAAVTGRRLTSGAAPRRRPPTPARPRPHRARHRRRCRRRDPAAPTAASAPATARPATAAARHGARPVRRRRQRRRRAPGGAAAPPSGPGPAGPSRRRVTAAGGGLRPRPGAARADGRPGSGPTPTSGRRHRRTRPRRTGRRRHPVPLARRPHHRLGRPRRAPLRRASPRRLPARPVRGRRRDAAPRSPCPTRSRSPSARSTGPRSKRPWPPSSTGPCPCASWSTTAAAPTAGRPPPADRRRRPTDGGHRPRPSWSTHRRGSVPSRLDRLTAGVPRRPA